MRSWLMLLLSLIAAQSPAAAGPGPLSGPALTVSGVVTSSRDGAPIARCTVTLSPLRADPAGTAPADLPQRAGRPGRPPQGMADPSLEGSAPGRARQNGMAGGVPGSALQEQETALTDAHGHFSLAVPHAGAWVLLAAARGYRAERYQQHDQFSTVLMLSSATPNLRANLTLKPASSISGFVLDEAGDGVAAGQITLQRRQVSADTGAPDRWTPAGYAQTDDRGHYELTGLEDGSFRLSVTAHPWYATNRVQAGGGAAPASASLDPSLDVVYPVTWFPGTAEERSADVLTVHAGEDRQADFHLAAIPALHLVIPGAASESVAGSSGDFAPNQPGSFQDQRRAPPQITRQTAGGPSFSGGLSQASIGRDGSWEIGGLSPGSYEIWLPNANAGTPDLVQVTLVQGSSTSVSLERAVATVRVAVLVEGADQSDVTALRLTSVQTGFVYTENGRGRVRLGAPRRAGADEAPSPEQPGIQVPPGEYFLNETLAPGFSLTGISATGARIEGRYVTVSEGSPTLTLHVQRGQAILTGTAIEDGKPSVGAMVLLVPAAYGSAGSLAEIRRDQARSDGTFVFQNVPPGAYLLVSLADGWAVPWRDPATLARYLTAATPLSLSASGRTEQDITSVHP